MPILRLLYDQVMDWTLRELRFLAAVADAGSFTDAAARLHVSQAAVSRTIAGLERTLGERLLRRVPRGCELTRTGEQVLERARRVLGEAARFTEFIGTRSDSLRLGYAWAALGAHTTALQRRWAAKNDRVELRLVKHNSPTAGLVEGASDASILRTPADPARFDSVIVGLERRVVAFAADDPEWARRRSLTMAEVAARTVVVDPRAGTTTPQLWRDGADRPSSFIETEDVDMWLDAIAAGRGVGTTAEATASHHQRPGVVFRPLRDGPRIPVRLAWWRNDPPRPLAELIDEVTQLYSAS